MGEVERVTIEPFILKYLKALNKNTKLKFNVDNIHKSNEQNLHGDRFTLHIPYCMETLNWDFIFDSQHPDLPPDILLPQNNFVDMRQLSSLTKWDARDDSSFDKLIHELLLQFQEYNKKLISQHKNERLQFEYNTIMDIKGVQFYLKKSPKEHVQFKIPLEVEGLAELTEAKAKKFSKQEKPLELTTYLCIVFMIDDQLVGNAKLCFPEVLDDLHWLKNIKLPNLTRGTCLIEYIPAVQDKIYKEIKIHFLDKELRKEFVKELVKQFGNPLEIDTRNYGKVSFLFHIDDFVYVTFFTISEAFPKEMPLVQLQSMKHTDKSSANKPVSCKLQQYPFKSTWSVEEMASAIKTRLQEVQQEFVKICSDFG